MNSGNDISRGSAVLDTQLVQEECRVMEVSGLSTVVLPRMAACDPGSVEVEGA